MNSAVTLVDSEENREVIPLYPEELEPTRQPKTGRRCSYDPVVASEVLRRMLEGEQVRHIREALKIDAATLFRWKDKYTRFRMAYMRAREEQLEAWSDDILAIADEPIGERATAHASRARNRIEARQWIMSRMNPAQWGDFRKVEQVGNPAVAVQVNVNSPAQLPYEQWCQAVQGDGKPAASAEKEND